LVAAAAGVAVKCKLSGMAVVRRAGKASKAAKVRAPSKTRALSSAVLAAAAAAAGGGEAVAPAVLEHPAYYLIKGEAAPRCARVRSACAAALVRDAAVPGAHPRVVAGVDVRCTIEDLKAQRTVEWEGVVRA
jgi:hypothetical protein